MRTSSPTASPGAGPNRGRGSATPRKAGNMSKIVPLKPPPPVDTPVRFLTPAGLVSGRAGTMPAELGLTAADFKQMDGTPPLYLVDVEVVMPGRTRWTL